jgi:alpha-glucosidase (family GH31 glycosyl hydrolase)
MRDVYFLSPQAQIARSLKRVMYRFFLFFLLLLSSLFGATAQTFFGNYTGHIVTGKAITVLAGSSAVRFSFYRPDILRVDFLPSLGTVFDSSLVVIRDTTENVGVSILESDSTLEIGSTDVKVICRKHPLRISYYDQSGQLVLVEPSSGGLATNGPERWAVFELRADEHFYGTGERGTSLDKRGQVFDSYNTQIGGYTSPLPTMNINVPFLASTKGYALYFEDTYKGQFDIGSSNPSVFSYKASGGELSFFLIVASDIPKQLGGYTWLTGRQPLPPRWAFGFIQSKYGYQNESEARAVVQTMREKQIPCDAIILDLYWYNQMGDISWNLSAFPNPFQMMADFLNQGIKTIVITEPYITSMSMNYPTAAAGSYFGRNSQGQVYLLNNWWSCGCDAGLLDLTNPVVQDWWWAKHPDFFGNELAGIWTDLGEPERHPQDMQHYLGSTMKVHNVFNLLWAKTIFDGYSQFRPNQRLFNLTRSGYAGIQRYGVIPWSGDVGKSFGGLAVQLPMLLNMGMSGLAYHNSDIGGFCCGTTTPELYVRWMQYGTFCPITRAHGTGQGTEPWAFDATTESICRKFIQLRYQLLPYIYTMAYENFSTGLPLARPLFFDYPNDAGLYNESSSYLWGDAFLVSPVVQAGQTTKSIYLPQGEWVNYWTDEILQGGQRMTVATPIETLPLFVKAGSILPMQSVMNYSDERPLDTLLLEIYALRGKESHFTLYEDDGKTLEYQSGSCAQTIIVQSSLADSLTISIRPTVGTYSKKTSHRVFLSEIHGVVSPPSAVRKNGESLPSRSSYQEMRQNGDGFFYDQQKQRLFIHTPSSPDSALELIASDIVLTGMRERRGGFVGTFKLEQNYPNPFNPGTVIEFMLPTSGPVALTMYNILGQEIGEVISDYLSAGKHQVVWAPRDLASGIYFYRLVAGSFVETRKLVLVR